jgi:hypothetical protein
MRDYGKVRLSFWTDDKMQELSDQGKLLALYLLSGPHSNSIGCFRLPDGYITDDLGWDQETVTETLSELSRNGFLYRCLRTRWVFISNYLKHNPPENPNVGKSMVPLIEAVPPKSPFYKEFLNRIETLSHRFPERLGERLRQGMPNPEPEPEPEPISIAHPTNGSTGGKAEPLDHDFEVWWQLVPRKVGKGQARKAYRAARKKADAETLETGVKHFAQACRGKDEQYIAHPATWLNGERWLDEAGASGAAAQPIEYKPGML